MIKESLGDFLGKKPPIKTYTKQWIDKLRCGKIKSLVIQAYSIKDRLVWNYIKIYSPIHTPNRSFPTTFRVHARYVSPVHIAAKVALITGNRLAPVKFLVGINNHGATAFCIYSVMLPAHQHRSCLCLDKHCPQGIPPIIIDIFCFRRYDIDSIDCQIMP